MKVKLLNNAGYLGMDNVEFPVIVEARSRGAFFIPTSEIARVGGSMSAFNHAKEWFFIEGIHAVEVVDE